MVTPIVCKRIREANTMASEKEFLVEFALNERPISPLSTTRSATQLLQVGAEG